MRTGVKCPVCHTMGPCTSPKILLLECQNGNEWTALFCITLKQYPCLRFYLASRRPSFAGKTLPVTYGATQAMGFYPITASTGVYLPRAKKPARRYLTFLTDPIDASLSCRRLLTSDHRETLSFVPVIIPNPDVRFPRDFAAKWV